MASGVVHLAVVHELMKRRSFRDPVRLKFGALLPDAGDRGGRRSHLRISFEDGRRSYDFEGFRRLFGSRMREDDLYLGYYLHLVQDALYRHFVYGRYRWDPRAPGNIDRLHRDYELVNGYVISRYALVNDLAVPEGFEREALCGLCSFDTAGLLNDAEAWFGPAGEGEIFFFTAEMSDEYISEAAAFCLEEIERIENGAPGLDARAIAWS